MNRIDRLMGLVTLLQSRRYTSAERLAQHFSISARTVYRDLRALDEIGIPVHFEPGRGYGLLQGYFLPPVVFSNDEANALVLMEALVQRFADKSIGQHYASALIKVKAVMKGRQKDNIERMHEHVRVVTLPREQERDWLSDIQQAIEQPHIMRIRYEDVDGEPSERDIEPIGLLFYSLNWHLIAWCWLRRDYRDFRVSRIVTLFNTGNVFRKQDHIALRDYQINYAGDTW